MTPGTSSIELSRNLVADLEGVLDHLEEVFPEADANAFRRVLIRLVAWSLAQNGRLEFRPSDSASQKTLRFDLAVEGKPSFWKVYSGGNKIAILDGKSDTVPAEIVDRLRSETDGIRDDKKTDVTIRIADLVRDESAVETLLRAMQDALVAFSECPQGKGVQSRESHLAKG